jgi:hypothetical protein
MAAHVVGVFFQRDRGYSNKEENEKLHNLFFYLTYINLIIKPLESLLLSTKYAQFFLQQFP